ncbi:LYPLAL1 [Symbiodinium microadriaticum]|nr:LYPLAL1 [Symbiodinium microadriaticum]
MAPPVRYLQDRSCPVFATQALPDIAKDCQCHDSVPYCFEDGRQMCHRSDGRLDLHYFAVDCESCICEESQDAGSRSTSFAGPSETTCSTADGAQDVVLAPDASGICFCPDERPLCVLLPGEDLGCLAGHVQPESASAAAFGAGCAPDSCSCRASCPSFASRGYADSVGDCHCPPDSPLCYEDGTAGCQSSTGMTSWTYFSSNCGARCECVEQLDGQCDPRSCLETADCIFSTCRDCDVCKGITRCPTAPGDDSITLPDWSGNCRCKDQQVCYEGGSITPGCPVAPAGRSQFSFQISCIDCICDKLTSSPGSGNVKCPRFARESLPGWSGDCVCPDDMPDCYQNGIRWCSRTDGQRDLHYFDPGCLDCECRAALSLNSTEEVKPCPDFSKFSSSNAFQNCICPDSRPICVQSDGTVAEGRSGPYCQTAQGWDSSTEFRHDCATCSCMESDGEGSNLRDFTAEEQLSADGVTYIRLDLVLDLRLVNSFNSLSQWDLVVDGVLLTDAGRQALAVSAAYGLSRPAAPAIGYCRGVADVQGRTVDGGDFEDVRVQRLYAELGVMWAHALEINSANGTGRLLETDGRRPAFRILQSLRAKSLDELTIHERELLLSLDTSFRPGRFKQQLDFELQRLLNETASWHPTPGGIQAPRISVSRATPSSDLSAIPPLSLVGPLAPAAPNRRDLRVPVATVQTTAMPETEEEANASGEFDLLSLLPMGIAIVSSLVGLVSLYCLVKWIRRCLRRRRERRAEKDADGGSGSPRSPKGSPRSPRSPKNPSSPRHAPSQDAMTATSSVNTVKVKRAGTASTDLRKGMSSVFDKPKREDAGMSLADRQRTGQKTVSAAAKTVVGAALETDGDDGSPRQKKGFMGRFRRGKDKGGSPSQSPRSSPRIGERIARGAEKAEAAHAIENLAEGDVARAKVTAGLHVFPASYGASWAVLPLELSGPHLCSACVHGSWGFFGADPRKRQRMSSPSSVLIFLHGSGDTGEGVQGWLHAISGGAFEASLAREGIAMQFPTAARIPYSLIGGMPQTVWFDRVAMAYEAPEDVPGLKRCIGAWSLCSASFAHFQPIQTTKRRCNS